MAGKSFILRKCFCQILKMDQNEALWYYDVSTVFSEFLGGRVAR
jgi:hypothetical protein